MMPTILENNWENFFKDHTSNEQSNKTMDALLDGFKPAKTFVYCLQSAIEEKETVFISKAPVTNHIMFLHHFTKIGGACTIPTSRIFSLIGTNESAFPDQLNKEILFSTTTKKFAPGPLSPPSQMTLLFPQSPSETTQPTRKSETVSRYPHSWHLLSSIKVVHPLMTSL